LSRPAPRRGYLEGMDKPARTPSNIYPSLTYNDANAAIEWLCRVFGFEKRLVVPGPDGQVMHSELSYGVGVIMVGSPNAERGYCSPRSLAGVHGGLCLRVSDPDAHYARARAAGAEITRELQDEEYGSRGYMARDLEGHSWYFGTYLPGEYWDKT